MKKFLASICLVSLMMLAVAISPAAAVPKLAGEWVIDSTCITPAGIVQGPITMNMTLNASPDATLFSGTITGGDPATQGITIMMDNGANMHFAMSWEDGNETQPHTHTWGQGTASTKKIVGSWINDLGYSGKFTGTRQ
jgi:hypothetical protein